MNNQKQQLIVSNIPLAVSADTCHVAVNNNSGEANLLFIQANPFTSNKQEITGVGVANIHFL